MIHHPARLSVLISLGFLTTAAAHSLGLPVDFSNAIEPLREKLDVPGLAVAACNAEGLAGWGVTGVRTVGDEQPVERGDLFHTGSLTKSMTATLAARFVERGLLRWDSTVGEIDGDLAAQIPERARSVTLEQLLSHRSGIPAARGDARSVMLMWQLTGPITERRLRASVFALSADDHADPGSVYAYSNLGYIVAGRMLEVVGGAAWEDLIVEEVFQPLGLGSVGFGPPGLDAPDEVTQPRGHARRGGQVKALPLSEGADNPEPLGPAGRVHCSIEDLGMYGRAHLIGLLDAGDGKFLSAKSWEHLHADPDGDGYALGWGVGGEGAERVSRHAGSNTMWFAVISIAPGDDLVLVAAMNATPSPDSGVDLFGEIHAILTEQGVID